MARLRVLFVSKPVVPPWNDGSKNLVRDVASHLVRARATVLVTRGAPPMAHVDTDAIYRDAGRFSPALASNARVFARLLRDRGHDAWHFFFAPNPASSGAARLARTLRRFGGPVFQTVASAPRDFARAPSLLFGDRVIALSAWTRDKLVHAGVDAGRLVVIPPCAPAPRVDEGATRRIRERHGLPLDAPLVLFPGDYEVSTGARTVAEATAAIVRAVPEARVVFACRPKSPRAAAARDALQLALGQHAKYTYHVGEAADMGALVAAASVIAFPVDDPWGKVDVPLVLIEALALGVPMVLATGGALEAVETARFVPPRDPARLAEEVSRVLKGGGDAAGGRALWRARFSPEVVAAAYDDLYDDARAK
jgi:phosphatidylinositol alpha-1,6-mannosyltransferase